MRELLVAARDEGLPTRADNVEALHRIAPTAIAPSVLARLGRLGSEAVALARAVAVLGASAEVMLAAALADIDPVVAELTADRLAAAQILAPVRPLEFFHPLIGAAVYADIPLGARRVAHRRAAELVDRRVSDRWRAPRRICSAAARPAIAGWSRYCVAPRARPLRLARRNRPRAIWSERLGRRSRQRFARSYCLSSARRSCKRGCQARRSAFAGRVTCPPIPIAERRSALRSAAHGSPPGTVGAREAFRDGVAELPDGDADLALELHHWCVTVGLDGLPAVVDERLRALVDGDAPGRTRIERVLLAHLAFASARSGARPHDEVARLARRALADGALRHDGATDLVPHFGACLTLVYADETEAAIAELDNAVESSQRRGSPVAFAWFSRLRGLAHYYRGELLEAMADLRVPTTHTARGMGRGCPERVRSSRCV